MPPIDEQTPAWAKLMYSENPNVLTVEKWYKDFYKLNDFQKNTHTQNYKFWTKLLTQNHWMDSNGFIKIPTLKEAQKETAKWKAQRESANINRQSANSVWEPVGPFETWENGQWISKQANIYTIDQSISNPNVVYCGTETGGVFKSSNKGQSWVSIGEGLDIGGVGTIKVHPNNSDFVLLGQGNNLYRSADGGGNWTSVLSQSSLEPRDILFIPASNGDPEIILVASRQGVIRSIDEGNTWNFISNAQCWDIDVKPNDDNTVYLLQTNNAAQHIRFYRSTNKGLSFSEINNGWFAGSSANVDNSTRGARLAVTPANPNYIYVALLGIDVSYEQDNNWIGVYKSTDGGSSWTLPAGDPGGPYSASHICLSSFHPTFDWGGNYDQGYYDLGIAASPTNAEEIMVGCLNLWKSADGGTTYTGIGGYQPGISGYSHPDIQEIEINGSDVWVATDGGVDLYASDLSSKVSLNNGINASEYWGFDSGWNDDVLVGGRYHNGNVVLYQNYPLGKSLNLGGAESATGYVNQGQNKKVYHSDIGGKLIPNTLDGSITNIGNFSMYPNQSVANENKGEIESDPRYYNHLYLTSDNGLFKSTDGGITFSILHIFGTNVDHETKGIEISRSNPEVIYVVQRVSGAAKVWKTINGGMNWNEIPLPTTSTSGGLFISLSPANENELYLGVSNGGNSTEKIYKTIDGGDTWSNLTTTTLDGHYTEQIMVQGGTDGGIYFATNKGVFYRNNSHVDWQLFSTGLPLRFKAMTIKPFYKEDKIRIATYNRGIYSAEYFEPSAPIAQPTVDKNIVNCARDTLYFEDYSMLNHDGASWQWSISPAPAFINATNIRNPKVVLSENGNYDVSLTVMNGLGQSNSKTIPNMISLQNECAVDTIPGKTIKMVAESDYFLATDVNLTNITHFTVSGWWKPDGGQDGFAALFSSGDWCAHCDYTEGLIVDYFGSRLWYKWPGNVDNWGSNSGMFIPIGEWSYVAMVIEPTGATLYLNEQKYEHNIPLSPADIQAFYVGRGHYNNTFRGEIDEVAVWNRALSEDEIYQLRHLTKENITTIDSNLIAYYQFNKLINNSILDHSKSFHGSLISGAVLEESSAPIGTGKSHLQVIDSGGEKTFNETDVKLYFPNSSTYPNGKVVVTKLNVPPDTEATVGPVPAERYWVINNYGTNNTFTTLDSIRFENLTLYSLAESSAYNLHTRGENAFGNTWSSNSNTGDMLTETSLTFATGNGINQFGQYAIHAESLACLNVVNSNDSGTGSLRAAINCAKPGQRIFFSPSLTKDPIQLTSTPLIIEKNISIYGLGINQTIIDGSQLSHAFEISSLSIVSLNDLRIISGQNTNAGGILNLGVLELKGVFVEK